MKRICLTFVILACAAGLCFAQQAKSAVAKPAAQPAVQAAAQPVTVTKAVETKTLTGRIDSVTLADAAKGTKSEIAVTDEAGKKAVFLVKTDTTIYDVNWQPFTLERLTNSEKVNVKYTTTKEGVNEATSVSIVK